MGQTTADRLWDFKKQDYITPENLVTIPRIRMNIVHELLDFTG